MKKIFFLAVFCTVAYNLHAQRATNETPYGFRDSFRAQSQSSVVLKSPAVERHLQCRSVSLSNFKFDGGERRHCKCRRTVDN